MDDELKALVGELAARLTDDALNEAGAPCSAADVRAHCHCYEADLARFLAGHNRSVDKAYDLVVAAAVWRRDTALDHIPEAAVCYGLMGRGVDGFADVFFPLFGVGRGRFAMWTASARLVLFSVKKQGAWKS